MRLPVLPAASCADEHTRLLPKGCRKARQDHRAEHGRNLREHRRNKRGTESMGEPFTGSACRINDGSLLVVRGSARFSDRTAQQGA